MAKKYKRQGQNVIEEVDVDIAVRIAKIDDTIAHFDSEIAKMTAEKAELEAEKVVLNNL
jgi:hypothetical protein